MGHEVHRWAALVVAALLALPALAAGIDYDLRAAIFRGDVSSARDALLAGSDVNATEDDGYTALMWSAWSGHAGIVKLLLVAGADVNAKNNNGYTVLNMARQEGVLLS